jgi:hypothetical protein
LALAFRKVKAEAIPAMNQSKLYVARTGTKLHAHYTHRTEALKGYMYLRVIVWALTLPSISRHRFAHSDAVLAFSTCAYNVMYRMRYHVDA